MPSTTSTPTAEESKRGLAGAVETPAKVEEAVQRERHRQSFHELAYGTRDASKANVPSRSSQLTLEQWRDNIYILKHWNTGDERVGLGQKAFRAKYRKGNDMIRKGYKVEAPPGKEPRLVRKMYTATR
jgi:hypothetical protein